MLMTHGSQQALELLGKIFINPGDEVLVENPTYLGAIQSFNTFETKYVTVPMDARGMRTDALEKAEKRVAAFPFDELAHEGRTLLWPWQWGWRLPKDNA